MNALIFTENLLKVHTQEFKQVILYYFNLWLVF